MKHLIISAARNLLVVFLSLSMTLSPVLADVNQTTTVKEVTEVTKKKTVTKRKGRNKKRNKGRKCVTKEVTKKVKKVKKVETITSDNEGHDFSVVTPTSPSAMAAIHTNVIISCVKRVHAGVEGIEKSVTVTKRERRVEKTQTAFVDNSGETENTRCKEEDAIGGGDDNDDCSVVEDKNQDCDIVIDDCDKIDEPECVVIVDDECKKNEQQECVVIIDDECEEDELTEEEMAYLLEQQRIQAEAEAEKERIWLEEQRLKQEARIRRQELAIQRTREEQALLAQQEALEAERHQRALEREDARAQRERELEVLRMREEKDVHIAQIKANEAVTLAHLDSSTRIHMAHMEANRDNYRHAIELEKQRATLDHEKWMFQTRLEAQDRERQREWDWRESERKSAERAQRMSAIMGLCMTLPLLMMGMNNRCSTNSSLHQTYYPQEQYVSYQDQGYYSQDYVPFVQANSGSDYNDGYIIKDSAVFKDGYQYKDSGNYRDDFVYQDGGLIDTNQSNVASLGLLGI